MNLKADLLQSIKKAMHGERDSVTLYEQAASHSEDPEVRHFFHSRANEEKYHYNYLLQYYMDISNDASPNFVEKELLAYKELHPAFSEEFLKRIGKNQYLFSAISTAVLLEKEGMDYYGKLASSTPHLTLKAFFAVLRDWEASHYDEVLQIQKEAEKYYWEINGFQPF